MSTNTIIELQKKLVKSILGIEELRLKKSDGEILQDVIASVFQEFDLLANSGKKKKLDSFEESYCGPKLKNSYMIFSNEKFSDIHLANPELKIGEIGKKIGALWRDLSEDEKQIYKAKEYELKKEYLKLKEEFLKQQPNSPTLTQNTKEGKKKVDAFDASYTGAKPKNSYMIFSGEKFSEIHVARPELKIGDISKVIAALWRTLSEEEKQIYKAKEYEQKKQYMKLKEEFLKQENQAPNLIAETNNTQNEDDLENNDDDDEEEDEEDSEDDEEHDDKSPVAVAVKGPLRMNNMTQMGAPVTTAPKKNTIATRRIVA